MAPKGAEEKGAGAPPVSFLPAQIWLGVNSVKPFSCPGQFPLVPDTIHLDLKLREVQTKLTELGSEHV